MLDPALRATLEQRLGEVQFARTLEASPTQTIKPAASTSKSQSGEQLPVISLVSGDAAAASVNLEGHAPDLEVRSTLGEGGMGRVQLAFQRSLEREVAVKTTREGAAPSASTALVREARITGTLEHPGIVPVHALGIDRGGAPVLVMKRVEGVEWGALIESRDHPVWATRPGDRLLAQLEIFMQICRTVHFAHTRGVLHLDIKPENVMVGAFGEVYLVDWGIARRFEPASNVPLPYPTLAGTPAYMAPEMVTGDGVDARTDVFLLGATLHTALTGEVRNRGANVAEVLAYAVAAAPHAYGSDIAAELAGICNRATAREPAKRFESAEALRVAVAEHLQHRSSITLAQQASTRSGALATLLASAEKEKPPADLQRAYQLASEARFGFAQALREWPDNDAARAQHARCLVLVVDLELRQGHVDAAEVVMSEIDPVPSALRERFDRARAEQRRQATEHVRLQALAHDFDTSVARAQRAIVIAIFAVTTTIAASYVLLRPKDISPYTLLYISFGFLFMSIAFTIAMRRKLLENAFNRQSTMLFIAGALGMLLNRSIGVVLHSGVPATLTLDILVLFLISTAGATTLLRGLWPLAGLLFVSLLATLAMPGRTMLFFAIDVAALPIVIFFASRRG